MVTLPILKFSLLEKLVIETLLSFESFACVKIMKIQLRIFFLGLIFWCPIQACNEAVCASIITLCQIGPLSLGGPDGSLGGSGGTGGPCMCNVKEPDCIQNCFRCLGHLFSECCSCLDLCPKNSYLDDEHESQIQDFPLKLIRTGMFGVLTEFDDPLDRWTTKTYKIDTETWSTVYKGDKGWGYKTPDRNCTVAYISDCLSWKKCKNLCLSMGSSSARWFFDGCCECVGPYCLQHGLGKSNCQRCPETIEADDQHTDIDDSYFDDENYEEGDQEKQQEGQSMGTSKQNAK